MKLNLPALCTVIGPVGIGTGVEFVGSAEDDEEEDNDAWPATAYKVSRLPLPQSSLGFPGQVIEQSVSAAFTVPVPSVFPQ